MDLVDNLKTWLKPTLMNKCTHFLTQYLRFDQSYSYLSIISVILIWMLCNMKNSCQESLELPQKLNFKKCIQ